MRRDISIDVEEASRLYKNGYTLMELGEHFGCSWMTIQRRLKGCGASIRSRGCKSGHMPHIDVSQIVELHEHGMSDYEIAEHLGISRCAVNEQVRKAVGYRGKGKSFSRELVCPRCGKRFKTMVKNQEYCSASCRNTAHLQRRDDEKRVSSDGPIEVITLRDVYERDHGRCYICGRRTDWSDYRMVDGFKVVGLRYPSRDHVIALHNGGTHTRDNIRLACCGCNSKKSDRGQMRLAI